MTNKIFSSSPSRFISNWRLSLSIKLSQLSLLIGCFLLFSCSQSVQLSPIDNDSTILALGDSLTVGVGTKPQFSYPSILQAELSQTIINGGVSGDKTSDGLSRLDKLLDQHNPALVIVCLGGNDFLRKVPKQKIKKNLSTIIQKIRASGSQVMLVAVPDFSIFISDSDIYQQVAANESIPLLTDVLSDLLSDDEFKSDPIHLNRRGYQVFAQEVIQFLLENGALENN